MTTNHTIITEQPARYLNAWHRETGATLGGWDTEHNEGWTSDGRNFTDRAAWQTAVNEMGATR
jgi:hypothetical protein